MSLPNRDPETGVRYGYISANSLHPEVIDELQQRGTDVHFDDARRELFSAVFQTCKDYMSKEDAGEVAEDAVERMACDFYDDEPVHEGEYEGVQYRTSWLGGALHVWIFKSPVVKTYHECSPCVPGAGNLDHPDLDGVMTYDVPDEWRWRDEN